MPLPFKDTDVKLLNNRNEAVRRTNQLKRRLLKDSKKTEDYKGNLGELLKKKDMQEIQKEDQMMEKCGICHIMEFDIQVNQAK